MNIRPFSGRGRRSAHLGFPDPAGKLEEEEFFSQKNIPMNLYNSGTRIGKGQLIRRYKIAFILIGVYFGFVYGIDFIISRDSSSAHKAKTTDWYILKNKSCVFLLDIEPTVLTPDEFAKKYVCIVMKKNLFNSAEENYYHLDCRTKLMADLIFVKSKDLCNKVHETRNNRKE